MDFIPHYHIYIIKWIISKLHIIEKVSDNIKDICALLEIRKSKIKTKSRMCARWDLKVIRLCHIELYIGSIMLSTFELKRMLIKDVNSLPTLFEIVKTWRYLSANCIPSNIKVSETHFNCLVSKLIVKKNSYRYSFSTRYCQENSKKVYRITVTLRFSQASLIILEKCISVRLWKEMVAKIMLTFIRLTLIT